MVLLDLLSELQLRRAIMQLSRAIMQLSRAIMQLSAGEPSNDQKLPSRSPFAVILGVLKTSLHRLFGFDTFLEIANHVIKRFGEVVRPACHSAGSLQRPLLCNAVFSHHVWTDITKLSPDLSARLSFFASNVQPKPPL